MRPIAIAIVLAVAAISPRCPVVARVDAGSVRPFPDVRVRTHRNETLRFYDDLVRGRVVLINFMFTTCTSLCPRATDNLVRVQRELVAEGISDVFLISISVDPEHDTPGVLGAYAARHRVQSGWTFVTGTTDAVDAIRRSLGAYDEDGTQHSAMLVYGDDARGSWAGMPVMASPAAIAGSVRRFIDLRRLIDRSR